MKASIALTAIAALAAKASAACWSQNLGYPCCSSSNAKVEYTDSDGNWGIENGNWCGIPKAQQASCWAQALGYSCCKTTSVAVYTDNDGKWGVENGDWCGIVSGSTPSTGGNTSYDDSNPSIGSQYTHSGNPFAGHKFFINPYYTAEVDAAIAQMSDSSLIAKAEKMKEYSNAIWLDNIENMQNWLERNLKSALAEQNATGKTVLTVFVVYDLPGRDCHALASNGELLANDADAARYKSEYIDVIEEKLKTYISQPVVLIIEPDSLANMVTNLSSTPACAASEKYYLDGHAYLIKKLGVLPHIAMYLDIGHAFWLGWDDNRLGASKVYSKVISSGSPGKVRGFASNVANYTPWEDPELSRGPDTEWNSCPDEKRYIEAMYKDFTSAGIKSVYFIEDTSRNGVKNDRFHPGEWCNQTGSGVGARPQANPISGMDYLDAFYWVKPYGESDGTSDESAKRYDGYCGHRTAMKPAPEAGQWFQAFFEEGIKNANPPL
ncbi:cellulosomal glycoside hydrolase family 6 exoglucanase Cel6A [Piromyces finnis]|uniref:Glucanase n=1 Tax=Piromyces finnis TaxID=1754191 RepID=A0A1Y1V6J1_9FUNG|nr:cellulosomal glycoside hydrolase family 6 exoglucanase Cel6A [Piromyces finnis]|eukprot:ORX48382.1 cellulosomal glycoside hydrolase family 6 exoglucanase Cel6A [Piromyces finnis]